MTMNDQNNHDYLPPMQSSNSDDGTFFYAGAGRSEALEQLWQAVVQDIPILILTGAQGSGKTTLCRKFVEGIPIECVVVHFPEIVESFEDIVRAVAQQLDIPTDSHGDGRYVENLVAQIGEFLCGRNVRLIMIFDEAENLYLATLERVRRMLDRVREVSAPMHILFLGRRTFLENCEQLTICDFAVREECRVQLDPLDEEETVEFCTQYQNSRAGDSSGTVLSESAMSALFEAARGNLRKTLELVAKPGEKIADESSFMTLLESVSEHEAAERIDEKKPRVLKGARNNRYLPWLAGGLGVLLMGFWLWGGGGQTEKEIAQFDREPVATLQKEESLGDTGKNVTAEKTLEPDSESVLKQAVAAKPVTSITNDQPEKPVDAVSQIVPEKKIETPPKTEEKILIQPVRPDKGKDVADERSEDKPKPEIEPSESAETVPSRPSESVEIASAPQVVIKEPMKEVAKVVEQVAVEPVVTLAPAEDWKIRTGNSDPSKDQSADNNSTQNEVLDVVASNEHMTADQLLMKRMQAGSPWVVGVKDDKFTVQLMVLTSKQAEDNLRNMLEQKRYRQESGNFYVFRKEGNPPQLLVFYGEYDTFDAARLAQESLPSFLRIHSTPYAISIKEAIAKIL